MGQLPSDIETLHVLRWLRRALEAHKGSTGHRPAGPLLLLSAVPERGRWLEIAGAVLRQEDGVLVDATICARGVLAGDLDGEVPELVAAVEEVLSKYNARDPLAGLTLDLEAGRAVISGTQDLGSVNAAQAALREVLAAACSADLRSAEIAALAYAEDALDADTAADVWRFVRELPALLRMSSSATLIIIAGDGDLRFDLHCQGEVSLRYRLSSRGLAERRSWRQNALIIRDLNRYSQDEMPLLVLFLGAGASVARNLPTGDSLRNEALSGLTGKLVDFGNWRTVSAEWYDELAERGKLTAAELTAGVEHFVDALTLERVIAVEQDLQGQVNSSTLRAFARRHARVISDIRAQRSGLGHPPDPLLEMLQRQRRLVLVTVNFDHVIEARAGNLVEPFYEESDLLRFGARLEEYQRNGGRVPLLKLHGDISHPDTIVANLTQTTAGLSSARDVALRAVIEAVKKQDQRPWFYVGYSMRDADLEVTWSAPDFIDAVNEYWVAPFLDPAVEAYISQRRLTRWQQAGRSRKVDDQLISLVADDFYSILATEVARHW